MEFCTVVVSLQVSDFGFRISVLPGFDFSQRQIISVVICRGLNLLGFLQICNGSGKLSDANVKLSQIVIRFIASRLKPYSPFKFDFGSLVLAKVKTSEPKSNLKGLYGLSRLAMKRITIWESFTFASESLPLPLHI